MIVERHSIEILLHIYWANVIVPQILSPFSVQFLLSIAPEFSITEQPVAFHKQRELSTILPYKHHNIF